jgi:endonuclease/exonuclease/phosphatase family metal-dependent hydrolase
VQPRCQLGAHAGAAQRARRAIFFCNGPPPRGTFATAAAAAPSFSGQHSCTPRREDEGIWPGSERGEDDAIAPYPRFRAFRRAALRIAVAFFALFAAYRAFFVYTVRSGCPAATPMSAESAPAGTPAALLKVLSYNIGGHTSLVRSGHLAAVAKLIADERPDVVGLQEVHRGTLQARFRDQAEELARATGMAVRFGPSFRALGGEFGNAVLVDGRVLAGEVLPLPSAGEPRSVLRASVEVRGFELDLFVTHLTAWGSLNRRMRTRQAACLVEQVRAGGRPYVLCGDLNATAEASELEALVGGDFVRLCGVAAEPTHSLLGRRLDYIFSDPRFEIVEAEVLRRGPSDHWPVSATLRWRGDEGAR